MPEALCEIARSVFAYVVPHWPTDDAVPRDIGRIKPSTEEIHEENIARGLVHGGIRAPLDDHRQIGNGEERTMRAKYFRNLMLLGMTIVGLDILAIPAEAQVNVQVEIQLPPPLVFSAPPQVIVLPETYVYVVPDIDEDVFFFDGWWWRPWQGRWYRSEYYDRGWEYYSSAPSFYREVPQDWRHEYRDHQWRGQPWNYERMPHEQVEKNWNSWKRDNYWEHHQTWGVQGLKPQEQGHGRPPQAPPSQQHGPPPQAPQSPHHGPPPQAPPSQQHGQPPQAQKQQSQQQPNKGQGWRHEEQGQGNKGQGQGKAAKQQGDKEEK